MHTYMHTQTNTDIHAYMYIHIHKRVCRSTLVVVSQKVGLAQKKVMVKVELPEFAVDDIEMFIGEVVDNAIDVLLIFKETNRLKINYKEQNLLFCRP